MVWMMVCKDDVGGVSDDVIEIAAAIILQSLAQD